MSNEVRVPPGVTLDFERLATTICSNARLDYDETALQEHELVTHLQERWREGVEQGLSTDAAEERVLRLFGSAAQVARSLRRPWLGRMLLHERCRADRYLWFLGAFVLYSWLAVLETYYRPYLEGKTPDPDLMMLPFHWSFFLNGLGSFGIAVASVGAVALVHWKPAFDNRCWNTLLLARQILGIVPFCASLVLTVAPSYFLMIALQNYVADFWYQGYCGIHLLSVLLGWLGAACMLAELFDVPGRIRRRKVRPFGLVS